MRLNRVLGLLLTGTLLLGVAGCGSSPDGSPDAKETAAPISGADAPGADGRTVVTLSTYTTLPCFEEAFETAYPQYDLDVEWLASGVINGEVNRRLRNHHARDLIVTSLPGGEVAQYTYDISAEDFIENYQSNISEQLLVDGTARYIPLPGSYYGYILNKTLLDELGLEMPETTGDLLTVFERAREGGEGVTEEGYCYGLSFIGATFLGAYLTADFSTDYLSTADGARWMANLKNGAATFTGTWEHSVDFLTTCVDEGYIDARKMLSNYTVGPTNIGNAFKPEVEMPQRRAILAYGDVATLEKVQGLSDDEFVMLPCLPKTANGNQMLSAISNDYMAVNGDLASQPEKLEGALAVMRFLSTPEGQEAWMRDTDCPSSYLNGYELDPDSLPESIRAYVSNGMVFPNPFPTNLLSFIGAKLIPVATGKADIADALAAIDDYYVNGSEAVEYDMSVVGTVAVDMIYENSNTRYEETQLGNLVSDAIRELTGARVALVNGGGIRSSFYQGDVTGADLNAVCPYGNLIIVAEMDGRTLREAITNGIQLTWKPAGQFLQVSGVRYAYRPASGEGQTAELLSLTYDDGTPVQDGDSITVAYNNYMAGSSGYIDAGDGFMMLNVYDESHPVNVRLVSETGKTFADALREYFANHIDEEITASLEGRIEIVND